jgi:hypothetical protein
MIGRAWHGRCCDIAKPCVILSSDLWTVVGCFWEDMIFRTGSPSLTGAVFDAVARPGRPISQALESSVSATTPVKLC